MKPHTFSVPYSVVENLPPEERFIYYELCRLAAPSEKIDEDFKIRLPKGALVTSHYRLSKILDYAYSRTAFAMESLAEKGLIDITPVESKEFKSYYVVQVKEIYPETKEKPDRLFPY